MKIHFQKTLAVILMAVTIITSLSINTMTVSASESNQITKADIANAIAQKRGLYCAPTFIQEFVVNLDEAVNYFTQKAQESENWNDIAVATALEIQNDTTLQEKIETVFDAAYAEAKSTYTAFDSVFGAVKLAFSPEVKAELMKDGDGGFILNYATHDPSKSVNALGEYGLTKDDYFDYENADSVAVYDEFVDALSTDINTYVENHSGYWLVRIPSYKEYDILTNVSTYTTLAAYNAFQEWLQSLEENQVYSIYLYKNQQCFVYDKWLLDNHTVYASGTDINKAYCKFIDENWNADEKYTFSFNPNYSSYKVFIPFIYANTESAIQQQSYSPMVKYCATGTLPEIYDSDYAYTFTSQYTGLYAYPYVLTNTTNTYPCYTVSKNETFVKVYKTLDDAKNAYVNKANFYINGSVYNSYDSSVDNSITYNSGDNYGYIYNTIDNSVTTGMTEAEVQALIVAILEQLQESENNGSGSGSIDSGDSGSSGSGGTGVLDVIKGLGSLGDTLLSLIGNVIQIASGFIKQLGDIITGLTTGLQAATGQVGEMIAAFFPFIPPEIISAITLGIVAIILIAVIKQIKG